MHESSLSSPSLIHPLDEESAKFVHNQVLSECLAQLVVSSLGIVFSLLNGLEELQPRRMYDKILTEILTVLLSQELYFVLLMKSHLQSYPCPLQINSFWNLGFLLGITIILQIITGIFLGLHFHLWI